MSIQTTRSSSSGISAHYLSSPAKQLQKLLLTSQSALILDPFKNVKNSVGKTEKLVSFHRNKLGKVVIMPCNTTMCDLLKSEFFVQPGRICFL